MADINRAQQRLNHIDRHIDPVKWNKKTFSLRQFNFVDRKIDFEFNETETSGFPWLQRRA